MLPAGVSESAYRDLLTSESQALTAQHLVTRRAQIYIAAGTLTLDRVLDALKVSRATWYRRLEAVRTWEAENEVHSQTPKGPREPLACNF